MGKEKFNHLTITLTWTKKPLLKKEVTCLLVDAVKSHDN